MSYEEEDTCPSRKARHGERELGDSEGERESRRCFAYHICDTVYDDVTQVIGYPVIVRSAFALGGLGSGFAHDQNELVSLVQV